jgi:hypothetical protein
MQPSHPINQNARRTRRNRVVVHTRTTEAGDPLMKKRFRYVDPACRAQDSCSARRTARSLLWYRRDEKAS